MLLTLEEDNERLKEELSLVQAEGNSMKSVAARLDELQLQASGYESLIEQENARVSELDSEVCILIMFYTVTYLCFTPLRLAMNSVLKFRATMMWKPHAGRIASLVYTKPCT